ncbi:MAG: hypothetical protein GXY50_11210 [Syntrophomonadaceae bacterium]|nr:hypothetical protein [Syntrophomonadaceae bacterium]
MGIVSFLFATLLILSGVALFMINLGYGYWWMIRPVLDYWPVLLIFLGLSVLAGGRKMPRWLAYVLILVLAAGVVFFFYYQYQFSYPLIPPVGGST